MLTCVKLAGIPEFSSRLILNAPADSALSLEGEAEAVEEPLDPFSPVAAVEAVSPEPIAAVEAVSLGPVAAPSKMKSQLEFFC